MAAYYVYSAAAGANDGSSWANAFQNISGAFAVATSTDTIYVADDHAQSNAANVTLTSPGSATRPSLVVCVRRSGGSVPPVAADLRTTATVTTTGSTSITFAGYAVYYGIQFYAGTGAVSTGFVFGSSTVTRFNSCLLSAPGTTGSATKINNNATTACCLLENTVVSFGAATDGITVVGEWIWRNTASAVQGTPLTTGLFASSAGNIVCDGVDLSSLTSTSTIFRAPGLPARMVNMLRNCKLGSSVTVSGAPSTPSFISNRSSLVRCDSGSATYRSELYGYTGTLVTTSSVYRSGGASDNGTPIGWSITPTGNASKLFPFECYPIVIWNNTTGSSVTVTVECNSSLSAGVYPNTDEIWMDVSYLGTASSALNSWATSGISTLLTAGAANTSSSAGWTGASSAFKLQVTITPQVAGPIIAYIKVGSPSSGTPFYVDPMITLS